MQDRGSPYARPYARAPHGHRCTHASTASHLSALVHTNTYTHRPHARAYACRETASSQPYAKAKWPDGHTDSHSCRGRAPGQQGQQRYRDPEFVHQCIVRKSAATHTPTKLSSIATWQFKP